MHTCACSHRFDGGIYVQDREPPETISELIKWARERRNLSQRDLAQALVDVSGRDTITRSDISRWERGKRIPTNHWLHWLSCVLQVPLPHLQYAATVARRDRMINQELHPPPWCEDFYQEMDR